MRIIISQHLTRLKVSKVNRSCITWIRHSLSIIIISECKPPSIPELLTYQKSILEAPQGRSRHTGQEFHPISWPWQVFQGGCSDKCWNYQLRMEMGNITNTDCQCTSDFMLLPPYVQNDSLVVLISRNGDHAGLTVVPIHGYRGVSSVFKPSKV